MKVIDNIKQISLIELLDKIVSIKNKHESEIQRSGVNFNIFRILKLETNEVRLHSAFIGELLNPIGSHGLKDLFLKLFIKNLNIQEINLNEDISAEVLIEEYIGKTNLENTLGGRIDLVIKTENKIIVIENKIFAPDQNKQLVRYKNQYPNAHLLYLTLDGKLPNDHSVYNENDLSKMKDGVDYHLISYEENISSWLKECVEASKHLPLLRDTIEQYINLIKYLTGQSMNENEISEVVQTVILNGEYTKAAMEISNSIDRAKKLLLMRFALEIKKNIISKFPDVITEINNSFGEQYAGISFSFQEINSSWIQLSFLSRFGLTYLEIYNDENYDHETNKINKNINLINNYKNELEYASAWGKVENVEKTWHGDWVCRYYKLDNYLRNPNTWADFANFNLELARTVSNDIEKLLVTLRKYGK